MKTIWNAEREDELTQLCADGLSASQIALRMGAGLSRNAIIGKARRLGVPFISSAAKRTRGGRRASTLKGLSGNGKVPAARRARKRAMRPATVRVYAPPPPKVASLPPTNAPIRLTDIGLFQCRYIAGDACGPDTLMCGAAVHSRSLCEFHLRLCWYRPPRKTRAAFGPIGLHARVA